MPGAGATRRAVEALWVVLGALAVLAGVTTVRALHGPAGATAATPSGLRVAGIAESPPGTCLDWPAEASADEATAVEVPCAGPHRLEVTAQLPGAAPGSSCARALDAVLPVPWDPHGALAPVVLVDERGDGTTCAVRQRSPGRGGADVPSRTWGPAAWRASQGQALVVPAGACLGEDLATIVDCDGTERARSAGPVELTELPVDDDGWRRSALEGSCATAAAAHLGRPVAVRALDGTAHWTGAPVHPALVPIRSASWDAGTRTTTCLLVLERR